MKFTFAYKIIIIELFFDDYYNNPLEVTHFSSHVDHSAITVNEAFTKTLINNTNMSRQVTLDDIIVKKILSKAPKQCNHLQKIIGSAKCLQPYDLS